MDENTIVEILDVIPTWENFLEVVRQHGDILTLTQQFLQEETQSRGIVLGVVLRTTDVAVAGKNKLLVVGLQEEALSKECLAVGDYIAIRAAHVEENTAYRKKKGFHDYQARVGIPEKPEYKILFLRNQDKKPDDSSTKVTSESNVDVLNREDLSPNSQASETNEGVLNENVSLVSQKNCGSSGPSTEVPGYSGDSTNQTQHSPLHHRNRHTSPLPCSSGFSNDDRGVLNANSSPVRHKLCGLSSLCTYFSRHPRDSATQTVHSPSHHRDRENSPQPCSSGFTPVLPDPAVVQPTTSHSSREESTRSASPPSSCVVISRFITYRYKKIAELRVPERNVNIYGVIDLIAKYPTEKDRRAIVWLKDESCGRGITFRMHIYFKLERPPKLVNNYILRLHRVKTELFADQLDGRVFHSADVVTFPPDGEGLKHSFSTALNFHYDDAERLKELRSWIKQSNVKPSMYSSATQTETGDFETMDVDNESQAVCETVDVDNEPLAVCETVDVVCETMEVDNEPQAECSNEPITAWLGDITEPGSYTLHCRILKVEALAKKPSYLILTVADGSLFIYKSHPKDTLRSDNTVNTVRILVKDSPVTVEECKDYDFVKLVAVDVDEIIEPNGESSELYMSLEMKFGKSGSKCRIVPLIDRENTAKRVKKQKEKLKSQNESEKPEGYGRQLVKEMLQGDFSEDLIGSATDNERETMDSRLSPLKRIRNISEKRPAPNEDENSKTKHKVMKTSDDSVISDEVLIIDDTESDEVTIIDDTESALPSQKESQPQWLSSIKEPHLKRVRERDKETGLRIRKRSNSNLNKDQKTGSATSKSNDKSTENEYELSSSVRKDTSKCNMRPKKRSISTPSLPLKERSTSVGNQNVSEREKSVLTASPPLPKKLRTATSLPTGNIRERNNSVSALGVSRNQDNASVAAAKQGRDQDFVSVIAEKQVRNQDFASVVTEKQSKNQDCASVVADKQVRNNDCASAVAEKQSKNQDCASVVAEKQVRNRDCASVVADKQVRNKDCASVVAEKQSKNQDCVSVVADKQVRNKDCASVVAEKQSKNQDCASVVAEKQNEQLTKSSSGTNKQQTSIKSPKKVQRSISLPQLPESASSPQKASRSTTLPLSPPGTLITITNSRDFIKVMKDIEREVIRKHCMPESSLSVTQEEDNVERRDIFSQKLNMFNVNSKKKQLVTNLHSNDAPSCSSRLPHFDDTIDHAIRNLSETRIVREQMTDSSKSVVLNALNAGSHDGATVSLVTKQNKACETEQGMNNFPSRTKDDSPYKILPREMLRREENDMQDDVPTSESRNQQGNQSILRNHCENEMVSRNQHNSQPVLEIQQENQSNSRKQQEKKPISTNQQENQPGFVQVESQNVPLENNCQNLPYSDWSTYNSHPTHTHLAPIARVAPVCRQADNPTTSVNEEGDESVSCIRSEHTSLTVLKKELNTVEQESNDKVCETFLSLEEGSEHQGSQHSSAGHREKSSDEITETYSDFEVCVRNKGTQHFTSTQSSGSGNGGPVGVHEFQTFALSQAKSETQKLSSSVENEESDAEFESAIPHVVSVSALSAACSGQALQSECGGGSDQMSALSQACPRELSSKLSGEEFESANPHVVSGDKASALSCSGQALQSECGGRSDQTSALSQACPRELPSKLSGEEFESAYKLRPLLEQPEKQAQSSNCEAVKEVSVRETESADVPEIVNSDKLKSLSHDNPERESLSLKCEVESELSSGEYESVGSPSDNFWSLPHTCPEQQALTSECGSKSDVSFEKLKSTELLCDKLKSLPHKPSEEQSGSSKPRTEVKLSDGECGSSGLPVVPREEQSILLHEHPEEKTVSSEVSTEEFYSPDLTGTCSGKLKSLSNDRLEELSSHSEAENEGFESADLPGIPSDDLRPLLRECPVERTLSRKCDVEKGVSVGMLDSVAVPGTSSDTSRTLPLECAEEQAQSSNHEVESGFSFAESEIPEVLSSSFETVRELETEEEPETDNQTFASAILERPGMVVADISFIKKERLGKNSTLYKVKAWLLDVEPPILRDMSAINLVSSSCSHCSSVFLYEELVFERKQPLCTACFQEGKKMPVLLTFLFRLYLIDENDDEIVATVCGEHGIDFVGCTVHSYLRDREVRRKVRETLAQIVLKNKDTRLEDRGSLLNLVIAPVHTAMGKEFIVTHTVLCK